jgi:hypothetical protein
LPLNRFKKNIAKIKNIITITKVNYIISYKAYVILIAVLLSVSFFVMILPMQSTLSP